MGQSSRSDDLTQPGRGVPRRPWPHAAATVLLCATLSWPALAADKPPLSPDQVTPTTTPSSISAVIEVGMPALTRAVERSTPRRLATFNDRRTTCWRRRFLGREVDVGCEYSGYVERVGGIPLRAEGGRLTASTPLFGRVTARGTGRFTSRIQGNAEGEMTVFASARPHLRPDWSVALDMSEGFRWTEAPTLTVLGFRIDVARYVEPRIRSQLGNVRSLFERRVNGLDIRGKAQRAWQFVSTPVQIVDNPPIWLHIKPESIAFSGIRARHDVLEGSVQIGATTETISGSEPAAPSPTPLPALGGDVSTPGQFSVVLPLAIGYDQLRQKIVDVVAAHAQANGLSMQEATVYPSNGKIVAGLRLGGAGNDGGDWVYLTAMPQLDAEAQVLRLADIAVAGSPGEGGPTASLLDSALIQKLQDQVQVAYQKETEALVASVNAHLTRPLADGFRSEGHLTKVNISKVLLLSDAIRLDIRAGGDLRILYGL